MKDDEKLRREFAEMIELTELAAVKLSRPWKLSTAILAVALIGTLAAMYNK